MGVKGFLFVLCLIMPVWVSAQIDSVSVALERIRACREDSLKIAYGDAIPDFLKNTAFGSCQGKVPVKFLGYKYCTNADAELFSWAIPLEKGLAYYNWFRMKEGNQVYFLRTLPGEKSDIPPYLFYDFLAFESNRRPYFVLLGWAQTPHSNQKAALIARFDRGGKVNFKSRLMRNGKSRSSSITFEYAKEGSMMLKHDKKGKRIIFDRLVPLDKKYEGFFMFYGPDGTNDALILKKGEWIYTSEVKR